MTQRRITAALIQHADQGDAAANLELIAEEIAAASQQGAQLVLLQELHNGAYFCQSEDTAQFDLAEQVPGPSTERLAGIARRHAVVIVGSLFERRAPGLYHNTAVVIERDGRLLGRYRKMHIPDDPGFYEKFYFTPGDLGFTPIDCSLGRLGVLVCWDQWYPEAARLMALAGAELLLYPTAIGWDMRDSEAERERQRDAWLTIQRDLHHHRGERGLADHPARARGRQRDSRAELQQGWPRSGAGSGRPGHPLLGRFVRLRAAGRMVGARRRPAAYAARRHRPGTQRRRAPHLAVPARSADRRLCGPAAPIHRLRPVHTATGGVNSARAVC